MTSLAEQHRLREALILGGAACAALVLAVALLWMGSRHSGQVERDGAVMPGFANHIDDVRTIAIETSDARFELERDGEGWALAGRSGFPADAAMAERVLQNLANLTFEGSRTRLPSRHAALGLVAPDAGGEATHIAVRDYDGVVRADLIVGQDRGETGVYIRFPGDDQTYAASGTLTLADEPERWMHLDFLALGVESIARVRIRPETGPAYFLERPGLSVRNFALRSPSGWRPITPGAGNGVGSVLSRLRFRDVRRATFTDPSVAAHLAETFGGLQVELQVFADGDDRWVTIRAVALTDDAEADALILNETADGWAFLLSDLTIDRLIRPLNEIAIQRNPAPDIP
jgi:Domain of unknown function (DUF4340)